MMVQWDCWRNWPRLKHFKETAAGRAGKGRAGRAGQGDSKSKARGVESGGNGKWTTVDWNFSSLFNLPCSRYVWNVQNLPCRPGFFSLVFELPEKTWPKSISVKIHKCVILNPVYKYLTHSSWNFFWLCLCIRFCDLYGCTLYEGPRRPKTQLSMRKTLVNYQSLVGAVKNFHSYCTFPMIYRSFDHSPLWWNQFVLGSCAILLRPT